MNVEAQRPLDENGHPLAQEPEHERRRARELFELAGAELRKPSVGAAIAGALVLGAGAVWGASEAAVAALAAYAVFRMLRSRRARDARESTAAARP